MRVLPFALTEAQQRVNAEIARDLSVEYPMHRLLQGDVGSGKTLVAVTALLTAVQGGYQGALHGSNGGACRTALSRRERHAR